MSVCAFCGQEKRISREHVWSSAVLRVFDKQAQLTIDEHNGRVYKADPVLRDICSDCNQAMSQCDSHMAGFARQYLTRDLPQQPVSLDTTNTLRWVLKTSANHSRVRRAPEWWREYVPFFLGASGAPDVDFFGARWRDTRDPVKRQLLPVHALESGNLGLHALREPHWAEASPYFEVGWALKVGSAVFAFIGWKDSIPDDLRSRVRERITRYGWSSLLGSDPFPKPTTPFNEVTLKLFYIISDPFDDSLLAHLQGR